MLAHAIHGAGDPQGVLEELGDELFIERFMQRQFDGNAQHLLTVEDPPRRTVGLVQEAPGRQRRAAIEDTDVVEPEEPSLEDVVAAAILAVDPPGEVDQQLREGVLEELDVALAVIALLVHQVDLHRGIGLPRRVKRRQNSIRRPGADRSDGGSRYAA